MYVELLNIKVVRHHLKKAHRHIRWLFCVFSLQKILGVESLDEVLDRQCVKPLDIIHNMTKVNKHGVVTLEDKTSRFIWLEKTPSCIAADHQCSILSL